MSFIHSTITRAAAFTAAMFASPAMAADVTERGMSESDFPLVQELVSGVYAYSDTLNAGQLITTVSLIVVTSEGVVVVDGQNTIEQGEAMVSEIKKLTDQPVKYRVIASDHGDHVNSLPALKAAYPDMTIIATPISKAIMAENAELPPVDETVTQARTLTLGGVDIRVLNIGRGHTGGDLVAYLPASDVLFMGELYHRLSQRLGGNHQDRAGYAGQLVRARARLCGRRPNPQGTARPFSEGDRTCDQ